MYRAAFHTGTVCVCVCVCVGWWVGVGVGVGVGGCVSVGGWSARACVSVYIQGITHNHPSQKRYSYYGN